MIERKRPCVALFLSLAVTLFLGAAAGADEGAARTRTGSSSSTPSTSAPSSTSSESTRTARPRSSDDVSTRSRSRARDRSSRSHTRSFRGHHYSYYGHGYRWYPLGWGPYWWGGFGWWGFGPNVVVVGDYGGSRAPRQGALDLDVHPEEAEIWIDGDRLGIADNFDGFPDYLWLPEGEYEIVIYHPGYRTIHREYAVDGGVLIEVDDRMDRGEGVHPQEVFQRETPRRDARMQRDRMRRKEADRARRGEDWRQRDGSGSMTPDPGESAPSRPAEARPVPGPEVQESRLTLRVNPDDSSVYLDGQFLGLARDWEDFFLSPGSHRLDVVRPGYESAHQTVDLEPGEREELSIDLEED